MALNENNKVLYENKVTIITAENLNNIQDSIIELQSTVASGDIVPLVNSNDNGKFLRVVDGKWAAVALVNAEEESF